MDITKYYLGENEKPLDVIKPDGGFFGIFRTVAVVGDSLSSGEFESLDEKGNMGWHDYYEYSWGQYMSRAAGNTVYNFSCGGMTAKWYLDSFGNDIGAWDRKKACQAYIFALGVNDVLNQGMEIGSADDVDLENCENNKPTFAGYYAKIIQKYKKISPDAYFFLMSMPHTEAEDERIDKVAALLHDLAKIFTRTYVLDLSVYAPRYDAEFRRNFYLGGHLNAAGYLLTAQMTMSYIDYLVRKDPEDFSQVGFVNKGFHNCQARWL